MFSKLRTVGKKASYDAISLELYTPFDFKLIIYSVTLSIFYSNTFVYQPTLVDKQTYFEIHNYL